MNWLQLSFTVLVLWSLYAFFAAQAGQAVGENVLMAFEAVGITLVALIVGLRHSEDFVRITSRSFVLCVLMATCTSTGFYLLLKALSKFPDYTPRILMISGLYPVTAAVIGAFILWFLPDLFPGLKALSVVQWIGVALCAIGLACVTLGETTLSTHP